MGGCSIDLEGGEYRISKPLVLVRTLALRCRSASGFADGRGMLRAQPEMNANMQFGHGSLVAAPDFEGEFLFVVGVKGSCHIPQGSCNIDVSHPPSPPIPRRKAHAPAMTANHYLVIY